MKIKGKAIINATLILLFVIIVLSIQASYSESEWRSQASENSVKTQLCLIIDGSISVKNSLWDIIKLGMAIAVNTTLPHDGSLELSIIQFGYPQSQGYAKVEISATVVNDTNYDSITNQILMMPKGNAETPMAHGLYLGWKELKKSPNFENARHVINLATDGRPNVRNNNATSDLDKDGGIDQWDDLIAVINGTAVPQGLNELDIEGINITDSARDWFKYWAVYPSPGIIAPPFSKPGWLRTVANATEFANTVSESLKTIPPETTWAPPAEGALAAGALTIGITSVVSAATSATGSLGNLSIGKLAERAIDIFPSSFKKWLKNLISSKTKGSFKPRPEAYFMFTKQQIFSIAVSLLVITFAFSYAKAGTLNEILSLIPIVLATSMIAELVKDLLKGFVARSQSVLAEYHLWYVGIAMFLVSSVALKAPFSSPGHTRLHSAKDDKRSVGLVSLSGIIFLQIFTIIFYLLFVNGFRLIGNMGLVICLTAAFFDTIPLPLCNGKDLYDWNKTVWLSFFIMCFTPYIICLLLL